LYTKNCDVQIFPGEKYLEPDFPYEEMIDFMDVQAFCSGISLQKAFFCSVCGGSQVSLFWRDAETVDRARFRVYFNETMFH
jgi:hypothetical protein